MNTYDLAKSLIEERKRLWEQELKPLVLRDRIAEYKAREGELDQLDRAIDLCLFQLEQLHPVSGT